MSLGPVPSPLVPLAKRPGALMHASQSCVPNGPHGSCDRDAFFFTYGLIFTFVVLNFSLPSLNSLRPLEETSDSFEL